MLSFRTSLAPRGADCVATTGRRRHRSPTVSVARQFADHQSDWPCPVTARDDGRRPRSFSSAERRNWRRIPEECPSAPSNHRGRPPLHSGATDRATPRTLVRTFGSRVACHDRRSPSSFDVRVVEAGSKRDLGYAPNPPGPGLFTASAAAGAACRSCFAQSITESGLARPTSRLYRASPRGSGGDPSFVPCRSLPPGDVLAMIRVRSIRSPRGFNRSRQPAWTTIGSARPATERAGILIGLRPPIHDRPHLDPVCMNLSFRRSCRRLRRNERLSFTLGGRRGPVLALPRRVRFQFCHGVRPARTNAVHRFAHPSDGSVLSSGVILK